MRPAHILLLADDTVLVFNANGARMPRLEGKRDDVRERLRELATDGVTVQRQVGGRYEEFSRWAL